MARSNPPQAHKMKIEKLFVYPIKALRAVSLPSATVTTHGFPHDRRFMLLHVQRNKENEITGYKNVHVAHYPLSVRFFPELDLDGGLVRVAFRPTNEDGKESEGGRELEFPLNPYTGDLETVEVEMHKSPVKCFLMPDRYSQWFSECYGLEVKLAFLGPKYRPVRMTSTLSSPDQKTNEQSNGSSSWLQTASSYLPSFLNPQTSSENEKGITFADCAPYLLTSTTSLRSLPAPANSAEDTILKFRPNILISNAAEAWEEDFWGELTITPSSSSSPTISRNNNDTSSPSDTTSPSAPTIIHCIHNCGRCKSINIDYPTGNPETPNSSLLKSMQATRRVDPGMKYSPIFGRYSFLDAGSEGNEIAVGDEVVVSKRLEGRTEFGEYTHAQRLFGVVMADDDDDDRLGWFIHSSQVQDENVVVIDEMLKILQIPI